MNLINKKFNKDILLHQTLLLETKIGYIFKNKDLLLNSMLHTSFVNENYSLKLTSNERMEFLGDAVLELVISEYLYNNFKDKNEGILSLKRSALVREISLAKIARRLKIQNFLILGKGERKDTGNKRDSILSDALEALIAGIYLDGGLEVAKTFILYAFSPFLKKLEEIEQDYNFKNQLQEYTQSHFKITPRYKLIGQTGPEHQKKFKVHIYLGAKYITRGSGTSKKKAEQTASKNALKLIQNNKTPLDLKNEQ